MFFCLFTGIPRFTSQPSPASVHLGDSQVMACEVSSELVPFTRWEKDRQPLELSSRLTQLPGGALVISNASEVDAGLYRCLVENVGSSKSSDEAQLQTIPGKSGTCDQTLMYCSLGKNFFCRSVYGIYSACSFLTCG